MKEITSYIFKKIKLPAPEGPEKFFLSGIGLKILWEKGADMGNQCPRLRIPILKYEC